MEHESWIEMLCDADFRVKFVATDDPIAGPSLREGLLKGFWISHAIDEYEKSEQQTA